ncbi:GNAT family N-acetyltransferase [Granulicatella sp. zg-ZJ]|uniref:GNAT family N-acetyltransferase n=1 Tax=Granulicatella sp. zg-ZJ TaxID=2678504 RepID=UPI0013D3DCB4|nr:GNAT family N-acetyltransferase [Granulicatella sp. zg-ZJ]NEW62088.1 GNAT family N-acetyltransferase [Granulicatella sp. zg-ZJ]
MFYWTQDINSLIYQHGLIIRQDVFIKEQQVPEELEIDEYESLCHYVVLYKDDQPVATARLLPKTDVLAKVQRVAVVKTARGAHLGEKLMLEVERYAKILGFRTLTLGAQVHAIPFYEKLGYVIDSDEYDDAGIMHKDMKKIL